MDSTNETKERCCCCHRGRKPLFIGLVILIIGLLLQNDYSLPAILIFVGAALIVKGVLVAIFKKDDKE